MWFSSRHKRALAAACAAASLLLLPTTSAAEPGPWPGLPTLPEGQPPFGAVEPSRDIGGWLNVPTNGRTGSTKSLQWAGVPLSMLASSFLISSCGPAPNPDGTPVCADDFPPNLLQRGLTSGLAFLVSPDNSPEPYGRGTLIRVRTVAFGSIPAEVTVQIEQQRDEDGLPVPFEVELSNDTLTEMDPVFRQISVLNSGTVTGTVRIRIDSVTVDGVDVGLGDTCASGFTPLSLQSKRGEFPGGEENAGYDPREMVSGLLGGTFSGTVDIPAFDGCTTTAGDDLSGVLTASLSGTGNPVSVQYGSAGCGTIVDGFFLPTPPGADTPREGGCVQYRPEPANPLLWAIPLPWDIPDYAPGTPAP